MDPAMDPANGDKLWYIEGVKLTQEEFNKRTNTCEGKIVEIDGKCVLCLLVILVLGWSGQNKDLFVICSCLWCHMLFSASLSSYEN